MPMLIFISGLFYIMARSSSGLSWRYCISFKTMPLCCGCAVARYLAVEWFVERCVHVWKYCTFKEKLSQIYSI